MHYYHKEVIIGGLYCFKEALMFSLMIAESCKIETPFIVKIHIAKNNILRRGKIVITLSYELFEEQKVEPYYKTFDFELLKNSHCNYSKSQEFENYETENKTKFEMSSTVNHIKTIHTICSVNKISFEIIKKLPGTFEYSMLPKDRLNESDIDLLEKEYIELKERHVYMIYPGISMQDEFFSYMGMRTFFFGLKTSFENLLFIETEKSESLLEKIHGAMFYYENENKHSNKIFVSKNKFKKRIEQDEKKCEIIKNRIDNSVRSKLW